MVERCKSLKEIIFLNSDLILKIKKSFFFGFFGFYKSFELLNLF